MELMSKNISKCLSLTFWWTLDSEKFDEIYFGENFLFSKWNFRFSWKYFWCHDMVAKRFLTDWNDQISLQNFSATLLWHIFDHSMFFVKFLKNHIYHVCTSLNKISLGWVLMTRGVLPTKSMNSGEYFEYLSCGHIFIWSKVIASFS